MKAFLLLILLSASILVNGQTITTIAGNGTGSYSGDGGMATLAGIGGVGGIEYDKFGNIYIAEYNNTIRKISPSGVISTVAGNGVAGFSGDGGPATAAQLNFSGAWMAIDTSGNLYLADFNNQRIRKITSSTGIITTIAGNGIMGFSGDGLTATNASFHSPSYISIDALGNLYVSDYGNNRIRKINAAGTVITIAGNGTPGYGGDGGPATSANLLGTVGMCNDSYGNLFFSDNNRIRKVDRLTGIITTVAGNGSYSYGGDGGGLQLQHLTHRRTL